MRAKQIKLNGTGREERDGMGPEGRDERGWEWKGEERREG